MEDNFSKARFEGLRENKYLLKKFKNKSAREFITSYIDSNGEITSNLQKAACIYNRLNEGSLNLYITESEYQNISIDDVIKLQAKIKDNSKSNFTYFYESYVRKIQKGYGEEYVQNALSDLKDAYYTYRKTNNPLWNLEDWQIAESEMTNLYNLLMPSQQDIPNETKKLEEK